MQSNALFFVVEGYNRYSIAALAGILDQEMPNLPLHFLRGGQRLGEEVRELASQYRRVVAAFSFMSPQLPQVIDSLKSLEPLPDNVTLIAGGPHPSGEPAGTLGMGFAALVIGEGEVAFPELLRRLFADEAYADVPNLAFFDAEDQLVRNRRGPWVNLDDYPPFSIIHRKMAAIEITRGCPWACRFCQTPFFLGGRMRYRSVDKVVYWLKQAKERWGARYARFISADCFCYGSPDGRHPNLEAVEYLLYEVSSLMGRENTFFGSFPSEVRPGSVTPEALELLKKYSTSDNIVIGAQSGSPRMLQRLHRGHSVEEVMETAEMITSAGLRCIVDFIFGLPDETPADRDLTLEVIRNLTAIGATINSHFFMPLPGTPLANAVMGPPDPEVLYFLENLTREKHELGRWKGRLHSIAAMEEAIPVRSANLQSLISQSPSIT